MALCLAAMIGCILPVGTMLAAEEETGFVDSVQEPTADESIVKEVQEPLAGEVQEPSADEAVSEEVQEPETDDLAAEEVQEPTADDPSAEEAQEPSADGTAPEEVQGPSAGETQKSDTDDPSADDQTGEETPETAVADPEEDAVMKPETDDSSVEMTAMKRQAAEEAGPAVQDQPGKTAPVIAIRLQGTDRAQALGGKIAYNTYIGNRDQWLSISVEQGGAVELYYYLDTDAKASEESRSEAQLADLWQPAGQGNWQEIILGQDGAYVVYAKAAAADGQTVYARTDGIVIDTTAPVITGIEDGGRYPEGTGFSVLDDNLEYVLINEQPALPSAEDGMYHVAAAYHSTSCVVRAKDKAGNEKVCGITVEGKQPGTDTTVITESKTYELKAGTAYRLDFGSWKLGGDSTVYHGGNMFYVSEDGSYQFERIW